METIKAILTEVKKAVVGKDEVLLKVLLAILADGHILLEDIPGVGKTTMATAFSKALGLSCSRVQFTPDVLPSDITGYSVYHAATGEMTYQPGAVLCNLFLADELNRANSRTQSALLEAMEEGQVTVDGVSRPVPKPFVVIATQNPAGAVGTQLLPDSQMDRFLVRLSLGYPAHGDELELLRRQNAAAPVEQVADAASLLSLKRSAAQIYMKEEVQDYLLRLIEATRTAPAIRRGASPRGTLALSAYSKAAALAAGRDYVVPRDVQSVFSDVIAHRLLWHSALSAAEQEAVLEDLLKATPAPRMR